MAWEKFTFKEFEKALGPDPIDNRGLISAEKWSCTFDPELRGYHSLFPSPSSSAWVQVDRDGTEITRIHGSQATCERCAVLQFPEELGWPYSELIKAFKGGEQ